MNVLPKTMVQYSIYKNLGSKNEPDWDTETPLTSAFTGLTNHNSIADLLSALGDIVTDYNVAHNEATTVISNDIIVVEASEIERMESFR